MRAGSKCRCSVYSPSLSLRCATKSAVASSSERRRAPPRTDKLAGEPANSAPSCSTSIENCATSICGTETLPGCCDTGARSTSTRAAFSRSTCTRRSSKAVGDQCSEIRSAVSQTPLWSLSCSRSSVRSCGNDPPRPDSCTCSPVSRPICPLDQRTAARRVACHQPGAGQQQCEARTRRPATHAETFSARRIRTPAPGRSRPERPDHRCCNAWSVRRHRV